MNITLSRFYSIVTIFLIAVVFIIFVFFVFVNSNKNNSSTRKTETSLSQTITLLSPLEFSERIRGQEGVVIDVRTPEEFAAGSIEGAINMDYYADDFREQLATLDKKSQYYVYCRSGNRSSQAASIMNSMGFTRIGELEGGFIAWNAYSEKGCVDC